MVIGYGLWVIEALTQRIIECQQYLQEHSKCGAAFYFDTLLRYINSNRECSLLMLNNGLEFCKAQMKQNALTDARHSDEEIEHRLAEIDDDIRKAEALLRHNLSSRGLLRP